MAFIDHCDLTLGGKCLISVMIFSNLLLFIAANSLFALSEVTITQNLLFL